MTLQDRARRALFPFLLSFCLVGLVPQAKRGLAEDAQAQSNLAQNSLAQNTLAKDSLAGRSTDAGSFLTDLGERAVVELGDNALDEAERERRFRSLFNESVDVPAIGRFVIGPHWRRASEEDKSAFLQVFEDAIVQRFLPLFAEYSGETFSIGRIRKDANNPQHLFVTTTILQTNGEPVDVEWRVRERDGDYQILDIIAEGVSMAITLRQEYSSVIRQSGVSGLTAQLRQKVEAGAFVLK